MKNQIRRKDDFYCENLKQRVKILKKFLPISSGRPAIKNAGVLVENDCSGLSEACGVRVKVGVMTKTDWSKCPHKILQKRGNI